ncbi:two-component sensor histidine kinase [Marinobacter vulgaris]|uniref:histidine kinase n=1 Tax=Marinobacter vulgaris TaxID=1928331 RepID=A0A2V3ZHV8_9GAMM|nr:ATP-binding protein [Marinobacter vulgaris]PXX90226.1 two-component sensor histidine kinase [Marinobacter vulgaris]TSJ69750.1 two-component sensor histidine kinase [Marinobacter vulgaris]
MPLKFFLKLYARLIGLTFLILLTCAALFLGVNSVREQFWQERFSGPLLRWIAATPHPEYQYHWLESLYDFRVAPPGDLALSNVIRERLSYGQVVARETSIGQQVMIQSGQGRVLDLRLGDIYTDVAEATALVARIHLDPVPAEGREETMKQLSGALAVNMAAVQDQSALPDSDVLERVSERGISLYHHPVQGRAHVLLRLEDGTLVDMAMPASFNPWAWPVVLLLLAVTGGVLALALFLALRDVDSNLRAVESVAIRIARGEMGARVDAGDSRLVSRLAVAFNSMAEHIQRLVGVQREMIHAVSHELRTPVARIRFGIQMIESASSPEALQKQLDGIDGDIQELDELIDEILTYARLEQGGPVFALQETSVSDIVRQVVSEQQMIRPGHSIEADIDDDSERWSLSDVEPRYLHRAVQNLVGNAARYAEHRVRVHCQFDEDNCRIDVEDDGPGIPEEDWEKVFTAFARLDDSRTRTSGGYGLGLSIVRRILYWHGGQAFVSRSEELGGARFSLVWPRKKPMEHSL